MREKLYQEFDHFMSWRGESTLKQFSQVCKHFYYQYYQYFLCSSLCYKFGYVNRISNLTYLPKLLQSRNYLGMLLKPFVRWLCDTELLLYHFYHLQLWLDTRSTFSLHCLWVKVTTRSMNLEKKNSFTSRKALERSSIVNTKRLSCLKRKLIFMTWSKQQKRKWVRCYLLLLFVFHNWCWSSLAVPGYNLLNLNYCEPYVNTFIGKSRLYKGRFYWSKLTMKKGIKVFGEWNENLLKSIACNICNKLLCSHSN